MGKGSTREALSSEKLDDYMQKKNAKKKSEGNEMKALYEKTYYYLNNEGKWEITEKRLCFVSAYASDWERIRLVGDRFYTNSGVLWSATSTQNRNKIKWQKVGDFIYEGRGSGLFDKLDKITDEQFKKLRSKAKRCATAHGIDFEGEACFISSSSVHGFYLPNNREGERVIAFIKGKAYLFSNDLLNEILDY